MTSLIRRSLPTALAGALVAGALAVPVIAQESGDDNDASESTEEVDETEDGRDWRRGAGIRFGFRVGDGLADDYLTDVAAELGIPVQDLQAAIESVSVDRFVERLDEKVAEGDLTQDQADRLAAAAADGTLEKVGAEVRLDLLAARLDEQVAAGELTRAEADEILAAAEDGDFPFDRRSDRRQDRRDRRGGSSDADDAAEVEVEDASV